jgi:hypothetical protein
MLPLNPKQGTYLCSFILFFTYSRRGQTCYIRFRRKPIAKIGLTVKGALPNPALHCAQRPAVVYFAAATTT